MPSHTTSIPSLGVQILRTGFYIYLAVYTLFRTLTLLPRHYKTWPFGRIAIVGLLKHGLLGPSWLPRYSLGPTTGQIIRSWARKNKVAHSQEEIKPIGLNEYPSYILHRLSFSNKDSHDQRPVLLYIHGGAFFRALTAPGHTVMAREIISRLEGSEAFILEYNLAPDAKYPVQHVQSVSALQHLLKTFPAEQIYIAGDSAGAHLATSILTHLQKPSPYHPFLDLNRGNTREGRLAGAVLISPYVKCNRDKNNVSKSVKSNAKYDYLDHGLDLEVQRIYAPKEGDLWAEPYHAPGGFWTGLKVDRVLVIVGDLEVLRDDAITFGQNMKRDTEGESVELVVVDDAIHVEAVIDLSLGYKNGNMFRGIVKWCEGVRAGRR